MPASLLGFGELLAVLYALIGDCRYAFIVFLFCRYCKLRKAGKAV